MTTNDERTIDDGAVEFWKVMAPICSRSLTTTGVLLSHSMVHRRRRALRKDLRLYVSGAPNRSW